MTTVSQVSMLSRYVGNVTVIDMVQKKKSVMWILVIVSVR